MENSPGDYIKKALGLSEQLVPIEKPTEEIKEKAESITIGKMEDVREILKTINTEAILTGKNVANKYAAPYYQEKFEKDLNLIREFITIKKGDLNSNSKVKLYNHIVEELSLKLDEAFDEISKEIEQVEIRKKGYKDKTSLSEEEKKIFENFYRGASENQRIKKADEGLKKLHEFNFNEQKINELKEKIKNIKREERIHRKREKEWIKNNNLRLDEII